MRDGCIGAGREPLSPWRDCSSDATHVTAFCLQVCHVVTAISKTQYPNLTGRPTPESPKKLIESRNSIHHILPRKPIKQSTIANVRLNYRTVPNITGTTSSWTLSIRYCSWKMLRTSSLISSALGLLEGSCLQHFSIMFQRGRGISGKPSRAVGNGGRFPFTIAQFAPKKVSSWNGAWPVYICDCESVDIYSAMIFFLV
jgi:hypothetical protein